MFAISLVVLFLFVAAQPCWTQRAAMSVDEDADVIDHTRFDSLWRASIDHGRLRTSGWGSEAYVAYRTMVRTADPQAFLPKARAAFWVNAYLACLMETMHLRTGYRSTAWDTMWLQRDTFIVAGRPLTLDGIRAEAIRAAGTVAIAGCLPTGSKRGAPLPPQAATARTVRRLMRDQMRRICRSERYVLYDPGGNVLQLSGFFTPLLTRMASEARSVADWVLPYVTEAMAAQIAVHAAGLRIQVHDVLETWRKARPP